LYTLKDRSCTTLQHHPISRSLIIRSDTIWASGVWSFKNFRQNNFHTRKIFKNFFYEPKKSGQKNFKAEKDPAKKFLSAKILRFDRLE